MLLLLFQTLQVFAGGSEEETGPETDIGDWDVKSFEKEQREYERDRRTMVETQISQRGVNDLAVLDAMISVPRHVFVPPDMRGSSYQDSALPIGYSQTISQPYIVGLMTEQLGLTEESRVLEIGTGSGYQAAVLSEITRHVYTIEIIEELFIRTGKILEYAGYSNVRMKNDDGYFGWEEYAPFDAIIVTAAAGHVPPPLIEQLKTGGKMIIPVGSIYEVQILVLVTKTETGIRTEQLIPVRFVPMTGTVQNE